MTRIYIMDPNGLPRFVLNQPAPVSDPAEQSAWMAVFAAVCTLPAGKKLSVKFMTDSGHMARAAIVNMESMIDILPGGDINLYMYASDITPEVNLIKP